MNLKLIEFHDHVIQGEFSAGTALFTELDRGRRLVATIDAGAPFEAARYPACEAFDVELLFQGKFQVVEYPSEDVLGLVKATIRRAAERAKAQ